MKFSRMIPVMLLAIAGLGGCAYFNTYYNTQDLYSRAEEKYLKLEDRNNIPRALSQEYDYAAAKALKVIEKYPNSKWVDDAMFINAMSNYRMRKFLVAQKMFRKLTIEFADSPHYAESMLYIARCSYENNEKKLAFSMLEKFTEEEKNADYFGDAMTLYAQLAMEEGDTAKADDAYLNAVKLIRDKNKKASVHYEYAAQLTEQGRIEEALEHLAEVEKLSLDRDLLGKVQLEYARIFRLQKNYTASEDLLKEMLANENYRTIYSDLELELAEIYRNLKDFDKAVERNKTVIESYANTRQASIAAYRIAEIELYDLGDLDKAKEYYQISIRHDKNSFEAAQARNSIKIISQFSSQKTKLLQLEKKFPPLTSGPLEHYTALTDSAAADSAFIPELESFRAAAEDYVTELINQAEILSFTFGLSDSSLRIYRRIEKQFPYTRSLPRVLYTGAYLSESAVFDTLRADSLRQRIVKDFPESKFARYITGEPDTLLLIRERDQARIYELERYLSDLQRADTLIPMFTDLLPALQDSESIAQGLNYTAWLYDNAMENLDSALVYYQRIVDEFPGSSYLESSKKRILELTAIINESIEDSTALIQEEENPEE